MPSSHPTKSGDFARHLRAVATAMFILAAGCFIQPPPHVAPIKAPLLEGDLQWSLSKGTAIVKGVAQLTEDGQLKPDDYGTVALWPVSAYSTEVYDRRVLHHEAVWYDSKFDAYVRQAIIDHDGGFEFDNLPGGAYYVVADVGWLSKEYSPISLWGPRFFLSAGTEAIVRDGASVTVTASTCWNTKKQELCKPVPAHR